MTVVSRVANGNPLPCLWRDVYALPELASLWQLPSAAFARSRSRRAHGIYNQDPWSTASATTGSADRRPSGPFSQAHPRSTTATNPCTGLIGCTTRTRDFFGNRIPLGGAFDIGAHEAQ
jgi:hypothetical protein